MYIVIEMQTNASGDLGTLIYDFADRLNAEQKFHTVLAAAAVSALPVHACVLMTNMGQLLNKGVYMHAAPPEEPVAPADQGEGE